jgi:hypothetical protein
MGKTVKKELVDPPSERPKPCRNRELYPDWPYVEWGLQTEEYFHTFRGLPNQGLNPYNNPNELPVKENDLIELFG